jgi:hypothetical protein
MPRRSATTVDRPPLQPSIRDLAQLDLDPSVETLSYSQLSLRDEQDEILVALGGKACATRQGA